MITVIEDLPGWQAMTKGGFDKQANEKRAADDLYLSPSGCNSLSACSMKYRYDKIMMLPRVDSLATLYGSMLHNILEYTLSTKAAGDKPSMADFWESGIEPAPRKPLVKAEDFWLSLVTRPVSGAKLTMEVLDIEKRRLEATFDMFMDTWYDKITPIFSETQFTLPVPNGTNLYSNGIVDLGCIYEDEFIILDFKSARELPKYNQATCSYDLSEEYKQQLATYQGMAWNWKIPESSMRSALLFFNKNDVPESVLATHHVTQRQIDALLEKLRKLSEVIRRELFIPNRSYMLCKRDWCPYWEACHAEFG